MKKAIIFLLAMILLSAITNAQASFGDGSRVLNVGVGMWSGYYRNYNSWGAGYKNSPTIVLSYEQALTKKAGPGYLGAGVLLSWQTSSYRYNDYYFMSERYYYSYRYTNYVLAGRLAYHWDELVSEDLDIYVGVVAGLRFQTYRYSTDYKGPDKPGFYSSNSTAVRPVSALFAGVRYYFKPKLSVYGEVSGGAGIPYVNVGLAFKL